MKRGNTLVIVLVIIIVILITVFATLYFSGVIGFNLKDKFDYLDLHSEISTGLKVGAEELNVDENPELLNKLLKKLSYSNYDLSQTDEYGNFAGFYFFNFKGEKIVSLSNEDKQCIAYMNYSFNKDLSEYLDKEENAIWFPKSLMEESIKELFGVVAKHAYTPTDFTYVGGKKVLYNSEKEAYKVPIGLGGRFPVVIMATYKFEKQSEYYIIYQKAIYIDYEYDDATSKDYTIVHLKNGEVDKVETSKFNTEIEEKPLDAYVKEYSEFSNQKAIMSNYYDRASEYKHVFKKDGNGNYIWHSSEKIK